MIRFTLPLSSQLNDLLLESAKKAERSRNAHIRWILRSFLLSEKGRRKNMDEVWEAMKEK